MHSKRLFLFAAYDKQGIIDESLLHYVKSLSELGDIIFVMDSDTSDDALASVRQIPHVLHASAVRHSEYDFGSYKRAYQWADNNNLLSEYDWVYLVNDSVYGPFSDLSPILGDLESRGVDLTGMIDFVNTTSPIQVQSWFVGLSHRVATADFLREFMSRIKQQSIKQLVVLKYEVGLSQLILRHGYQMSTFISGEDGSVCHSIYERPIKMLKRGLPFIKKTSLQNLTGLQYLYPYASDKIVDDLYHNALRVGLAVPGVNVVPQYKKHFRLTLFSVPVLTIYQQRDVNGKWVSYKGYAFDCIPIIKIFKRS